MSLDKLFLAPCLNCSKETKWKEVQELHHVKYYQCTSCKGIMSHELLEMNILTYYNLNTKGIKK